jgi:uncharacterized protein YdcH (DUF465 family)
MGVDKDLQSLHVWTHNQVESLQSQITYLENRVSTLEAEIKALKPKSRKKLKLKDPKSE